MSAIFGGWTNAEVVRNIYIGLGDDVSDQPAYDADVLISQLTAIQTLNGADRREIGEVLLEYGREMIASADRLDELQRFTLAHRARQEKIS